ncbi:glycosyltransferase family 4 protein [Olleya aquimaris]|uniref:Glycosyltransferase involved in cell wall biosynthesis n=1 Tax=Olleya aquimaris TaxID=639310 RepID=A0A327RKP5_9FLAO|nr:glycosyltransferase family 4 protein [Olleya aquimaris]RAJ16981.1 glycosyltransferase involved in cell wall biosynthesis [Olleya aquimaris]
MKQVAILGPINSRGGREIETAFIADVLKERYEVSIFSTETIKQNNDLYLVNPTLDIYTKFKKKTNKLKALLGFKINYDNLYFKNLNNQNIKSLNQVIKEADLIVIMAQLTSNYTKEIILAANNHNKKVIYRTTGTIPKINLNDAYFSYVEHVSLFINHSEKNSTVFKQKDGLNYKIIDQCVFKEDDILVKQRAIDTIKNFYCASRLDKNKDVITVIKAFNAIKDREDLKLHIIGDGPEIEHLKSKAEHKNIKFYGHLKYDSMIAAISNFDCLIVSSIEEAGPYNALEAALLGIPILSTKSGAMPERFFGEDNLWFDQGDWEGLSIKILEYSNFDAKQIKLIQKRYIEIYNNNHSKKTIAKAYLDAVSLYL